jgi:murein DD-endopeptidase MepM/ murein hydrolase activator NlpD
LKFHKGLDIGVVPGTPIRATAGGMVIVAGRKGGYGKTVVIDHLYSGYTSLYAHLSRVFVARGEFVNDGEVIGLSGNTGRSTGPHLHYEVMRYGVPENPLPYILNSMHE